MKYSLQKRISAFVLAFALVMTTAFNSIGATTKADAAAKVKTLYLTKKTTSLVEGETGTAQWAVKATKATKALAAVKVTTSDPSVVKITKTTQSKKAGKTAKAAKKNKGTVKFTAVSAGTATIKIVTKKKTKKTKSFKVTVTAKATEAPATTQAPASSDSTATTEDPKANALVQSVSLSNNTPKVGDTIEATVAFKASSDAATFAWYTVDATSNASTLIDGATSSSIKVTEAMVGKYIKVQATGSDNSSAVATTTSVVAASDEAELAITAKQIGASKILVTANKAITKEDKITVTRGTSEIGNTFVPSGDGLEVVVNTEVKIGAAEYTVKVAPKDTKKAAATAKFTGVASTLEKIDFVGDELVLTSATFDACSVKIFGYDNFGDEVSLSTLTPYTSKGDVKYEASTNEIIITSSGTGVLFQTGESITVTAIYQDGTTVKQVAKALKVSEVSAIKSITLGELQTTKAELKGKAVTMANLSTGTYYKTIEAIDQYKNKLTAKDLTARLNTAENPTGSLFIAGSLAAGSYVQLTGFDTLDGKVIAKYTLGGMNMPGTQLFTFTAVGGYSTTDSITVVDNPYIADLTVDVPELYGTKTATITLSAKDQNGDAVDLFNFVEKSDVITPAPGGSKDFVFTDVNGTTKSSTKMTIPDGLELTVDKDTAAKTVKFSLTAGTNTGAANITKVIVVQTAAPTVSNVQCAIQQNPKPYGLSANMKDTGSNRIVVAHGQTADLRKQIVVLDQYGSAFGTVFDSKDDVNAYTGVGNTVGKSVFGAKNYEVVLLDKNNKTVNISAVGNGEYTANLYLDEDANTTTKDAKLLSTKTFTVYVAGNVYHDFEASLTTADKLLYIGAAAIDTEQIKLTALDENNERSEVTLDGTNYSVELADLPTGYTATDASTGAIDVATHVPYVPANGEVKGNITANVYQGNVLITSVKVPYSNAPSVTAKYVAKVGDNDFALNKGVVTEVGTGSLQLVVDGGQNYLVLDRAHDKSAIAADIKITAVDQYGLSFFSVLNGKTPLVAEAWTAHTKAQDITGNTTITLFGSGEKVNFNVTQP